MLLMELTDLEVSQQLEWLDGGVLLGLALISKVTISRIDKVKSP